MKDPAEIGFLLLPIASSIGASSGNFLVISLVILMIFIVLGIKWLMRDRSGVSSRGSLMISMAREDFARLEGSLSFLAGRLKGLSLHSVSTVDDRVNLQYQCKQQPALDWAALANDLNRTMAPSVVDVFVG